MNPDPEDAELLRRYAEKRLEPAFAELVRRHINLVYASALRRVGGDAHLAEDVTQQVFTALAGSAKAVADRSVLVGWLHLTTRNQAAQIVRTERRRQAREQDHQMNESTLDGPAAPDWARLRPVIDGALDEMEERDREAVLLRYFEGRSYAEMGARLRLTENAARMRVDRALERMHGLLSRRGVTSSVGALALALSGAAAVTAPSGLAASVTGAALAGAVAASGAAGGAALITFMSIPKIVSGVATLAVVLAIGSAYHEASECRRAREDLQATRVELDKARARAHDLEQALAQEKSRTRAAEDDTGALLTGIEQAQGAAEARAKVPITSEVVKARFKHGQDLARAGNLAEALPEFLWCYDEGMVRVVAMSAVRLSYLTSELGKLAARYPPAAAALRARRDVAAKTMETSADFQIASEFAALNAALGEEANTLAAYDKLPADDPRRQSLLPRVYDQLIARQRYAEVATAVPYAQMTSRFALYTVELPMPATATNGDKAKDSHHHFAVTEAAKSVEVLAGAGKLGEARELTGKLLAYDSSPETGQIIQEHLVRAGHPELAPVKAK